VYRNTSNILMAIPKQIYMWKLNITVLRNSDIQVDLWSRRDIGLQRPILAL
jgi:hypothetical protein